MIQGIYDDMWGRFRSAMDNNRYELDPYILDPDSDTRRGITALAYLDKNNPDVCAEIAAFQERVKCIEPQQYFQPISDLHLTILSIISCFDGFQLSDINSNDYLTIFRHALSQIDPIEIHYRGVSASTNCIVIQGFPANEQLNTLRDTLRDEYKASGLQSSLDVRYRLVTAHSSVIRFCLPLQNSQALFNLCQQYRNHEFGSVIYRDFDLVFNDWYQSERETKMLGGYSLA